MPTLTIRNVPDALHRRLKVRAKDHRRSLNAETMTVLEGAVPDSAPVTREEALGQIAEMREQNSFRAEPGEIERIIREGRDSGYGRDAR